MTEPTQNGKLVLVNVLNIKVTNSNETFIDKSSYFILTKSLIWYTKKLWIYILPDKLLEWSWIVDLQKCLEFGFLIFFVTIRDFILFIGNHVVQTTSQKKTGVRLKPKIGSGSKRSSLLIGRISLLPRYLLFPVPQTSKKKICRVLHHEYGRCSLREHPKRF